jgi:predicted RNase H-like HicB family nuclease
MVSADFIFQHRLNSGGGFMKLKVIVHEAEEGGYWAEVPSIPGCATQGETFDELLVSIYEAVEGCLSVDMKDTTLIADSR